MNTDLTAAPVYSLEGKRVWIAGHRGMVGQALVRRLSGTHCTLLAATRQELDLTRQAQVEEWVRGQRPQVVILAAAKVGGILVNHERPAEFLYENLAIEMNVIEAARRSGVEKLLLLGSSCIYPRMAAVPTREEALLTGPLEPTNEWYAIAKIAGIKLCQAYRRQFGCDFITAMPTNLYGPHDNFDLNSSHVVPALIRKIDEASCGGHATVDLWGTGRPRREFLHVDDCADALVHLLEHYSDYEHVNIGTGRDHSISELAAMLAEILGFSGTFRFDTSRPDGAPHKCLDVSRMHKLGWQARIGLRDGLEKTCQWYREHRHEL